MVKKTFLLACLFSLLFTVPAMAASSKAKLLTDTSSSANTVPFINAGPAEDSTAATALGVQVNGTERMRVTATGSVGIGTTSPVTTLDVNGLTHIKTSGTTVISITPNSWNTITHNLNITCSTQVIFAINGDLDANNMIIAATEGEAHLKTSNSFQFYASGGYSGPARINWFVLCL